MKVYGRRSSRKPTSLENLFRTRPTVETVKALDHRQTDRQITSQTDRHYGQVVRPYTSRWTDTVDSLQTNRKTNGIYTHTEID